MKPYARFAVALLVGVLAADAGAVDFMIDVKAQAAKEGKSAEAKYPAAADAKPPQARTVLMIGAGMPVTVKWLVRNIDKGAAAKDVLVHFFVVQQEKPNQQEVPKLTKNVIAESALKMDFKMQDKTDGEITFTIPKAGCYLIRLELEGAADKAGREPYAALDLVVR